MNAFILEVQQIVMPEQQFEMYQNSGCIGVYMHVGYMNVVFRSAKHAKKYYSKHNPHMRPMTHIQGVAYSDVNLVTRLRYVLRPYALEVLSVPPFDVCDLPSVEVQTQNRAIVGIHVSQNYNHR